MFFYFRNFKNLFSKILNYSIKNIYGKKKYKNIVKLTFIKLLIIRLSILE